MSDTRRNWTWTLAIIFVGIAIMGSVTFKKFIPSPTNVLRPSTSRSVPDSLVPLDSITGKLPSRFASPPRTPLVLDGDASSDAKLVLQEMADFWQNIESFRVMIRKAPRPSANPKNVAIPLDLVLIAENPNRLLLRYTNWDDGDMMISDGSTVRVSPPYPRSTTDERFKRYGEGDTPQKVGVFLSFAMPIALKYSLLIGNQTTLMFPNDLLMPLLPHVASIENVLTALGFDESRLVGIESVDGVDAYHLECFKKSDEHSQADRKLHLWIAVEGPPLLLKCQDPQSHSVDVFYTNWVLEPVLPEHTFQLPPTHDYKRVPMVFEP